ncbi:MAG TPA: hypothetical protein PLA06_06485, partial [Syntrophorhabdaceae bacterium]|nr:hypothetical protein [Syntrophorhabdaceae bacterium]
MIPDYIAVTCINKRSIEVKRNDLFHNVHYNMILINSRIYILDLRFVILCVNVLRERIEIGRRKYKKRGKFDL